MVAFIEQRHKDMRPCGKPQRCDCPPCPVALEMQVNSVPHWEWLLLTTLPSILNFIVPMDCVSNPSLSQ